MGCCPRDFLSPSPDCPCDGFSSDFFSRPGIPTDGPLGVFVPETAAQWEALGIPAPDSLWLMQGAGPNVADEIGGISLIPRGGGALTYEVTVPGWDGRFIEIPEVANSGLELNSASYDPAADAVACLAYGEVLSSAGTRTLAHLGVSSAGVGAGGKLLRTTAAGIAQVTNDGASVNGGYTYEADGIVHPFLFRWRPAAPDLGSLNLFTDREPIVGVVDLTAVDSTTKGWNNIAAGLPPNWRLRIGASWFGDTKIALLGKATLSALRWPLFY